MKAQVITLHSVANYGTQLQALATQEKLKQFFTDVRFIDYRRQDTHGWNLLKTFSKGNFLRAIAIFPTLVFWHFRFGNFRKRYLQFTTKRYNNVSDLKKFDDVADVYFVGSDQVWNSGWNGGVIPAFYLSFIPNSRTKISFSSSFGRDTLSKTEAVETRKYLQSFKALSVREPSGVEIVKNQLHIKNVIQLVDPVLSLPTAFWRGISKNNAIPKRNYILIYSLNRNPEMDKYASELAKRTGLCLIRFCTRFDQVFKSGKSRIIPKIPDLVSLIDHADFVLTDSFHATAFAMLMNTPPICVYPGQYSNRISEFLTLLEEPDCHLNSYEDFEIIHHKVNFVHVNEILKKEREKVDAFLEDAIFN
ncbi:MAG: polysaccharide pyruvyl transferase family protein [Lacticaseibacillus paracasei]|nr:polysaccharide pyruvyl transferase family protein [Lacticaseibacillus paracasei]MCH4041634.1 polysaccharide pyruvyl transferase family protein [Lacticaseibacillus paracasei]MCH4118669.1 polysaccharide pyruvyl transferase family protein [Lacticaseibacillus paracasei]MCH4135804.1 polysaccharide pyruvyl transferase family protein [Lacticaseibacillus paracasei]MCH4145850.1 polysaccharide pyruvyl transferase family protein [Lacticaseibacillus paracasei]